MKYRLIGENDFLNPIETILKNRGVEDTTKFLKMSKKNTLPWNKLKNIEKAVECLIKHIEKKHKIFVQVDADKDGYDSGAVLINYLNKAFDKPNIVWRLHEGKEHGVIVDTVPEDTNLVIIPDAGSNQYEEHKQLRDKGMDIIVLDHHEAEKESEDAIVVNNQLSPDYSNKTLTGVGIVYKFCQALDEKLNVNYADDYMDLVAMGNIADSADLRNLETRYYVLKGLKKINNPFLEALIKQQAFSLKGKLTITGVSFYIAPLVNATIRLGTQEEKEMMFKALLGSDEEVYYQRGKKYEPISKHAARKAYNLKNKQNRLRDKGLAEIQERIESKGSDKNKIIIVNVSNILDKTLTGLVANKVAETYKRPALLFRVKESNGEHVGGSARGYEKGAVKDLKQFLNDTNQFVFCEGHANAHGFEIHKDKLIETNAMINELLKDHEIDDYYDVDFILTEKQLSSNFITDIYKYRDVWGNTVKEPLIAFKNLTVNRDDISFMGKKENTLKFKAKGIDFIQFFVNKEELEEKLQGEAFDIDVVGKCTVNEYEGKKTPQIQISDFKINKLNEKVYIF